MRYIPDFSTDSYTKRVIAGITVYMPKFLSTINYVERIYEDLVDSKGSVHHVQVEYKDHYINFNPNDIYYEHGTYRTKYMFFHTVKFQYNLREYIFLECNYDSTFQNVNSLVYSIDNELSYHDKTSQDVLYIQLCDECNYYPIVELCYRTGNNHYIRRVVSDKIFFSYTNKKEAFEKICNGPKLFNNKTYCNMSEIELSKFLLERFKSKLKFEELITKKHVSTYRY